MKITSLVSYPVSHLLTRIREVRMLHDHDAKPYKDSDVSVTEIDTKYLWPAQRYVLRSELDKIIDLRRAFLHYDIDILRLADAKTITGDKIGYIEYTIEGCDDKITILPPVIEHVEEANKEKINLINDGMHRCYLARQYWIIPAIIRIQNIPPKYPYYAYPLPGSWSDVEMVDKLSKTFIKKFHRFPSGEYQKYYRDFNSAFGNVGGPRGSGK